MPNATENLLNMARNASEAGMNVSYVNREMSPHVAESDYDDLYNRPQPIRIQDPIDRILPRPDPATQHLLDYYVSELRRITNNPAYDHTFYQITRNGDHYDVIPVTAIPAIPAQQIPVAIPTINPTVNPFLNMQQDESVAAALDYVANTQNSLLHMMGFIGYDPATPYGDHTGREAFNNKGIGITKQYPKVCPLMAFQEGIKEIKRIAQLQAAEENFKNPMEGMDV